MPVFEIAMAIRPHTMPDDFLDWLKSHGHSVNIVITHIDGTALDVGSSQVDRLIDEYYRQFAEE